MAILWLSNFELALQYRVAIPLFHSKKEGFRKFGGVDKIHHNEKHEFIYIEKIEVLKKTVHKSSVK